MSYVSNPFRLFSFDLTGEKKYGFKYVKQDSTHLPKKTQKSYMAATISIYEIFHNCLQDSFLCSVSVFVVYINTYHVNGGD